MVLHNGGARFLGDACLFMLRQFLDYLLEPGAKHADNGTLVCLLLQHAHQKLLDRLGDRFVSDAVLHLGDLFEHRLVLLAGVERLTMQQLVEDNPYRPNIHRVGVGLELGLFRRDVFLRAGHRLHNYVLGAQSKIGDFEIGHGLPLGVLLHQQNVLGLEIPVRYPMVVQLLHALGYLQDAVQRFQL